jgi:hypothetical protein
LHLSGLMLTPVQVLGCGPRGTEVVQKYAEFPLNTYGEGRVCRAMDALMTPMGAVPDVGLQGLCCWSAKVVLL